jgi:glycosyltransferase involved in cell wall biosynthesis
MNVLVSAMHLISWDYIETLNITTDTIIVNQCDSDSIESLEDSGRKIKFICSTERGLSRSRNMAIRKATSDICILCDNDVEYIPGYEKIIENKFETYRDADIVVFFIKRDATSKPYAKQDCKMNHKLALKVFSPEIAFRKKSLEEHNIIFNEEFGAGSTYMMGEENIFLYECFRKKLKIYYCPVEIAQLRYVESTWKINGRNEKFFKDKGACYYAMAPRISTFLNLQFVIRKRRLYSMSPIVAFKYMEVGKSEYRKRV